MKRIIFIPILTILFSCKNNNNGSQDYIETGKSTNKGINTVDDSLESDKYSFLSEYPNKPVPLIDSTNFNNLNTANELTAKQKDLLHLNKILGENYSDVIQSVQINYRINLSDNFSTIAMSYELGEHELLTTLVNYDNDFKPITWNEIAYDEIAEGLVRKQSKIYRDSIIISRISYFDEVPDTTFTSFQIDKNGLFINMEK